MAASSQDTFPKVKSAPADEMGPASRSFMEEWKLRRFRAQVCRMGFGADTVPVCTNIGVAFLGKGSRLPDQALLYVVGFPRPPKLRESPRSRGNGEPRTLRFVSSQDPPTVRGNSPGTGELK